MSKYKLIGEDEHVFKVQHPDGSEFHIAKHAVGQAVHKRIKALEPVRMADGGEVKKDDVPEIESNKAKAFVKGATSSGVTPSTWISNIKAGIGMADGGRVEDPGPNPFTDSGENPSEPIEPAYQSAASPQYTNPSVPSATAADTTSDALTPSATDTTLPSTQSPAPASAGVPSSQPDQISGQQGPAAIQPQPEGPYSKLLNTELEASKGIAEAQKNLYENNASALKEAVNKQAKYDADYKIELDKNNIEHTNILDAIRNQQIDPNRLFHQPGITGTLSNIGAALSVVLSGIGSGLSGKPNMAMEVIQKNIDRDIEAQKMDLGKNQSLLSENLRKYGNIRDAQRATSAQLWTGVRGMMESRANQSQSQQAIAQGQLRGAEIGMNVAKMNQELATNVANAKTLGYGGQTGGVLLKDIPYGLTANPQFQEKAVQVFNPKTGEASVYQAHDKDQAKDLNKMEAIYRPIVADVKTLQGLAKDGVLASAEGRARAQAIQGRLAMAVNEFNGYKRFTDVDDKIISKQFNDPSSIASLIQGQGATNDTLNALKTKIESERKQALPGYKAVNFNPGL